MKSNSCNYCFSNIIILLGTFKYLRNYIYILYVYNIYRTAHYVSENDSAINRRFRHRTSKTVYYIDVSGCSGLRRSFLPAKPARPTEKTSRTASVLYRYCTIDIIRRERQLSPVCVWCAHNESPAVRSPPPHRRVRSVKIETRSGPDRRLPPPCRPHTSRRRRRHTTTLVQT